METVKIEKVYPTKIWHEKDWVGTVNIKMQHEGCEPFNFIQIQYDHRYTSNAHQHELTENIMKLLGAGQTEGKGGRE